MPNLPGNPYAEHSGVNATSCENDPQWGIAQAVMALAFEQRTANLTSLMAHCAQANAMDAAELLHPTIAARLGVAPASN